MLLRHILSRVCKHQRVANLSVLKYAHYSSKGKSLEKGYVVSYLVNSCGLSPENAISASKRLHFDAPDKPNAVLSFLEKQGFSKSQIAELVRKKPRVLVSKPDKSLLPKIEIFLHSSGISKEDALATLARRPDLLAISLKHRLVPVYNYLEDTIGTEKAQTLLRNGSWIFNLNPTVRFIPNVDYLKKTGVPPNFIELAFFQCPGFFSADHEEFKKVVGEVKEMGFDVLKSTFILAIHARKGKGNLELWDKCFRVYSKWGWSKDDIHMAFRKHPYCMLLTEPKISKTLDFIVTKLGRDARSVAPYPYVMFYSMEKRIVPRSAVLLLLSSKGLVKKDWSLASVLAHTNKVFLEKYVTKYAEQVPQIYDIYQEKLGKVVEA